MDEQYVQFHSSQLKTLSNCRRSLSLSFPKIWAKKLTINSYYHEHFDENWFYFYYSFRFCRFQFQSLNFFCAPSRCRCTESCNFPIKWSEWESERGWVTEAERKRIIISSICSVHCFRLVQLSGYTIRPCTPHAQPHKSMHSSIRPWAKVEHVKCSPPHIQWHFSLKFPYLSRAMI